MLPEAALLPLYRVRGGSGPAVVVTYALVDPDRLDELNDWRWGLSTRGYAARMTSRTEGPRQHQILLHRYLLGLAPGDSAVADHINRARLDNRLCNLRITDLVGNAQNVPPQRGRVFSGATWNQQTERWQAQVQLNGRQFYLGQYGSEEEAGDAAATFRRDYMPLSNEASELAA